MTLSLPKMKKTFTRRLMTFPSTESWNHVDKINSLKMHLIFRKSTSGGKDNRGMYKFSASNTSCVMDDDDDSAILLNGAGAGAGRRDRDRESNSASIYEQLPRELLRDLRRPQHFQRLGDDAESLASNSKAIMLKDLVKYCFDA